MSSDKKWRLIEGVVEALERGGAPDGAVVTRNVAVPYRNDASRTRQVDVHVAVPVGPRTLTVGIEVKGRGRPLTVEDIEQIDAKLGKLKLDRRCLVSRSGFAEEARRDAVPGGLELLTLEELDSVSWWLGPMYLVGLRNQIRVVHVELVYDAQTPPKIVSAARGLPVSKCELVDVQGETATLHAFGVHHGITALKDPAAVALEDGSYFQVVVRPPTGSWSALRHGDVKLPPPTQIVFVYLLHQSLETNPLTAYALHGQQALTSSFPFVGGKDFQATIVGKEGDMLGSVDLKLVVGPVKVPKTEV